MITAALLTACSLDPSWARPLSDAAGLNDISTDEREAMWLAQCCHESGGLKYLVENMNYGPQGLRTTFGKHFTAEETVSFAHDGKRIANRAYANRNGNGDEASGDGWMFRGRGLLQCTGRQNYSRCGTAIGIDLVTSPELLEQPLYAALSAGWYWRFNGLNLYADSGSFASITRRINGPAMAGQKEREGWLSLIQRAQA